MNQRRTAFLAVFFSISCPVFSFGKTTIKDLDLNGSFSLNWRNVGPEKPGNETQIQNQASLSDLFFGTEGKINQEYPLVLEFQAPTISQGKLNLYRFSATIPYEDRLKLELGKFLVPFGHYNELYRADKFLSITRPLLYASPDSLDLVLRLNSPRPPFSAGYADIGARLSYYPHSRYLPSELTVYVVNGFGETNNRSRAFPSTDKLNVEPVPVSGVNIDFGHLNNNLADNHNNKAPGGRISFALGDFEIPSPIKEGVELKGARLGFSGMFGRYDLEEAIGGEDYRIFGSDLVFQYKHFSFTGEYIYSETDFRMAQADRNNKVDFSQNTDKLPSRKEINRGYHLQLAFPISESPFIGQRLLGILAFGRLERRGPKIIFSDNGDPVTKLPVSAFPERAEQISTAMDKYTAGLNLQLLQNFLFKQEYSYWRLRVPPIYGSSQSDIYQLAFSCVFSF